jgi:hypothetical protein
LNDLALGQASDEILGVEPSKEWQASVRIQLRPHRGYLQSPHFRNSGYLEQYTARFRAFVDEVLNEPTAPPMPIHPNVARIDALNQRVKKRAKAHHR